MWGQATPAFSTGDPTAAMANTEIVKAKAATVMGLLNMQVPSALR